MQVHKLIRNEVSRTSRNLLAVNLLCAVALAWCAYAGRTYIRNFFSGPFTVDTALLSAWTPNETKEFVTVKGEKLIRTSVQEMRRKDGEEVAQANYLLLLKDNRLLVVRDENGLNEQVEITGELKPLPQDAFPKIQAEVKAAKPGAEEMLLPVMLDDGSYRTGGYICFALGVPLFLLNLFNIFKAVSRSREPARSPIALQAAKFGDLNQIAAAVESDMSGPKSKYGWNVTMGRSWLVYKTWFETKVFAIDQIVWAYPHVTKHSVNFIPTHKSYKVILWTRNGENGEFQMRKKACDEFIGKVRGMAPWMVAGFSPEISQMWTNQRAEFLAAVDGRKNKTS